MNNSAYMERLLKQKNSQEVASFYYAKELLQKKNCKLVAHYYTDGLIQSLAETSGGFVGDSLDMAIWSQKQHSEAIIVAGVYFMGETIKILNPEKRVTMTTKEATCSLDLGCDYEDFKVFCEQNSERTVVAYINTSAKVKTLADWVITSRKAVELIYNLEGIGKKILWAPDKHMGSYIKRETSADILCWDGACIVHESFKTQAIKKLVSENPNAAVFVHPEAPIDVIELATFVGSTKDMVDTISKINNEKIIVATDSGIFYQLARAAPGKQLIEAPSGGTGATCKSCAHCPWMEMNSIERIITQLENNNEEIIISEEVICKAREPLEKMVNFDKLVWRY